MESGQSSGTINDYGCKFAIARPIDDYFAPHKRTFGLLMKNPESGHCRAPSPEISLD